MQINTPNADVAECVDRTLPNVPAALRPAVGTHLHVLDPLVAQVQQRAVTVPADLCCTDHDGRGEQLLGGNELTPADAFRKDDDVRRLGAEQ